jgi:uroporphyrinogen-III synthase
VPCATARRLLLPHPKRNCILSKTLLLVRPEPQSSAFAEALSEALPGRFRVLISPLMKIEQVDATVDLSGIGALLFTSANGVECFAQLSADRSLPAFCVGTMTATAARAAGFNARSAEGDVEALADLVISRHAPESGACLHVRGVHAAGQLEDRLELAGIEVRPAALYDQVETTIEGEAAERLARGGIDVLTIFSPRTAAIFRDQAMTADWPLGSVVSVSLSLAADAGLGQLVFAERRIASQPGRAGMIEALDAI